MHLLFLSSDSCLFESWVRPEKFKEYVNERARFRRRFTRFNPYQFNLRNSHNLIKLLSGSQVEAGFHHHVTAYVFEQQVSIVVQQRWVVVGSAIKRSKHVTRSDTYAGCSLTAVLLNVCTNASVVRRLSYFCQKSVPLSCKKYTIVHLLKSTIRIC